MGMSGYLQTVCSLEDRCRYVELVRAMPGGSVSRVRHCVTCGNETLTTIIRDPWRDPEQAVGGATGRDRDERRER